MLISHAFVSTEVTSTNSTFVVLERAPRGGLYGITPNLVAWALMDWSPIHMCSCRTSQTGVDNIHNVPHKKTCCVSVKIEVATTTDSARGKHCQTWHDLHLSHRVSATLHYRRALVKRALVQSNLAPALNKDADSEIFNTSESRSMSNAQNSGNIIDSKRTPVELIGRSQWSSETWSQSSSYTK